MNVISLSDSTGNIFFVFCLSSCTQGIRYLSNANSPHGVSPTVPSAALTRGEKPRLQRSDPSGLTSAARASVAATDLLCFSTDDTIVTRDVEVSGSDVSDRILCRPPVIERIELVLKWSS